MIPRFHPEQRAAINAMRIKKPGKWFIGESTWEAALNAVLALECDPSPVSPPVPTPKTYEDGYLDGYKQGIKDGCELMRDCKKIVTDTIAR